MTPEQAANEAYEPGSVDLPSGQRDVADLIVVDVTRLTEVRAELAAALAALARVLSWFPVGGTRNEASATRAQLAHAYRDGGLTVPEDLRRFI
jgi:hypothetical protein